MGNNLGCSSRSQNVISEKELLTCFREKTPKELFDASWVTSEIFDFPFVPVHGTPSLPDHPLEVDLLNIQKFLL